MNAFNAGRIIITVSFIVLSALLVGWWGLLFSTSFAGVLELLDWWKRKG